MSDATADTSTGAQTSTGAPHRAAAYHEVVTTPANPRHHAVLVEGLWRRHGGARLSWTLTPRQHETLRLIAEHMLAHGCAPSLRELAAALGVRSTEAVRKQLRALVRYGKIGKSPRGTHRGLRILDISSGAAP